MHDSQGKAKFLTRDEIPILYRNTGRFKQEYKRIHAKTAFLISYRHALRVGECSNLRWEDINWRDRTLYVRREKNGIPGTHLIRADELRWLKKVKSLAHCNIYVFAHRIGTPISIRTLQNWYARCKPEGSPTTFHGLRHSCAVHMLRGDETKKYDLTDVQKWLGHRNIASTTHYLTHIDVSSSDVLV